MKEFLKTSIIQSNLFWEDVQSNLDMFSKKIGSISEKTDLIILPEMFTTGFTMNASKLAEEENGTTLHWMQHEAKKNHVAITGSIIVADKGSYFNRLFFVYPDGEYITYDKRHTFTLADEHKTYSSGNEQIYVNYLGWKLYPLICYDLRFPVWSRNTADYDVLIYVASWPEKRIAAWDALLKARAIENMCYTIGVNRVGEDGNGHQYTGHSSIYDVLGGRISTEDHEKEFIETHILERSHLELHRKHLQFLKDQDNFNLK
jgi:predicted amidohydrolase